MNRQDMNHGGISHADTTHGEVGSR
jgi:hypothetical protein